MTRADAKRAATLSVAFEEIGDLLAAVKKPYEPRHGYEQMLVQIGTHECDGDPYNGGSGSERIFVDLTTAERIVHAARAIIIEELAALGVTADAPE